MKKEILALLRENARISVAEIAARLDCERTAAEAAIHELEEENIICGYKAIVNEEFVDDSKVKAIIEVKVSPQRDGGFDKVARRISKFPEVVDVFLVSGNYDLNLEVHGNSLQDIASFVSAKLSTIDGIISTATLFLLKKYKESGKIFESDEEYERLKITP